MGGTKSRQTNTHGFLMVPRFGDRQVTVPKHLTVPGDRQIFVQFLQLLKNTFVCCPSIYPDAIIRGKCHHFDQFAI